MNLEETLDGLQQAFQLALEIENNSVDPEPRTITMATTADSETEARRNIGAFVEDLINHDPPIEASISDPVRLDEDGYKVELQIEGRADEV